MENLENLKQQILSNIQQAPDVKALDEIRVSAMGKKGAVTELMKGLGALPQDQKIEAGKKLNVLKQEIESALSIRKDALETAELNQKLASESVDVTLPIRPENQGRIHPVSKFMRKLSPFSGKWALMWRKVLTLRISFITLTP